MELVASVGSRCLVLATWLFVWGVVKDDNLALVATNVLPINVVDGGTSAFEVEFVDLFHLIFKFMLHGLVCDLRERRKEDKCRDRTVYDHGLVDSP